MVATPSTAVAQLFGGGRQLGQPLNGRNRGGGSGGAAANDPGVGQVRGSERFLRSNRRRGDFVGADRFEPRGFVGSGQGTTSGPVLQSTVGVIPSRDRSRQINRPLPRVSKKQAYYPSLQIDWQTSEVPKLDPLLSELQNPEHFSRQNQVEVSVVGRRAILRGVVVDAKQKDLAELLVSFEPGISEVANELRVETLPPPRPTADPSRELDR